MVLQVAGWQCTIKIKTLYFPCKIHMESIMIYLHHIGSCFQSKRKIVTLPVLLHAVRKIPMLATFSMAFLMPAHAQQAITGLPAGKIQQLQLDKSKESLDNKNNKQSSSTGKRKPADQAIVINVPDNSQEPEQPPQHKQPQCKLPKHRGADGVCK